MKKWKADASGFSFDDLFAVRVKNRRRFLSPFFGPFLDSPVKRKENWVNLVNSWEKMVWKVSNCGSFHCFFFSSRRFTCGSSFVIDKFLHGPQFHCTFIGSKSSRIWEKKVKSIPWKCDTTKHSWTMSFDQNSLWLYCRANMWTWNLTVDVDQFVEDFLRRWCWLCKSEKTAADTVADLI